MMEVMLGLILVLVFYNSKLWAKGEWEVNKTKWLYYWKSK